MDRFRAGGACGLEQLVLPQVAVGRGGTAERDSLIGKANVQ